MNEHPTWYLLAVGLLVAYSAASALRALRHRSRDRREARQVDQVGETALGRIVAVAPLQRAGNRAAGHPVDVAYHDRTGVERRIHDASGLGGYLAREGTAVTVRYHPDNPALARVEQIHGQYGPFPVDPDGRSATPTFIPAVLALIGAVIVLPASYLIDPTDINFAYLVFPLFAVVGLVVLVAAISQGVRSRGERSGPREEAVGAVTEVWPGSTRGGGRSLDAFAVHFAARDGREVHARYPVASSTFRPQPGRRVRIRYDPRHPSRFEVVELGTAAALLRPLPYLLGAIFMVVGTVGTGFLFVLR